MKKRFRVKSPWALRIRDIIKAMGWTMREAPRHFGYATLPPLYRLLNGGRPSVGFLLRLKKLESAYADEIKAHIYRRRRPVKRRHIEDYSRPSDLSTVGNVGTVGQDGRDGYDPGTSRPCKIIERDYPLWYWDETPRKTKPRRPPAEQAGQGGSVEAHTP